MTVALEGGEWSAVRPGRTLPPGKTRYPFCRRLGGPQGRSGRAEYLVPTGIRSRTVQPVVSCYTDWATGPTKIWIDISLKSRFFSIDDTVSAETVGVSSKCGWRSSDCTLLWIPTFKCPFNPLNAELNPIYHLLALLGSHHIFHLSRIRVNPLKAELNPICHLLALLGAHRILHLSRIRVNPLNAELNPICHLLALLGAHHILHLSRITVNLACEHGKFTA